jgi:subtilase family serine protease
VSIKTLANVLFLALLVALTSARGANAGPDRMVLYGHVPSAAVQLTAKGRLPATHNLCLAIGLPLRNQGALDDLLEQIYDPQSPNFHKFLTPPEFTARFGPTVQDYQAVIGFAEANGLAVTGTHDNRVVLDVEGSVSNVERAFRVTLRTYRHPREARDFFAPDSEPSVPTNLPVADMWGLTDYGLPRPLSHKADPLKVTPLSNKGSGPGGAYQGADFRNAYVPGASLTGSGQVAAVVEFDSYYANDIATYETRCGYTHVPLQNVLLDGVSGMPGYSGAANAVAEVSLDIELLIAMAPGLSTLIVYEGKSPYDVFNRIATDNAAKQVSSSWSWTVGPAHNWSRFGTTTLDSQLQEMAAQGQTFFQASGDSDAYTGAEALSSASGPISVDSIFVTCVGGTTLNMNGAGGSWSSETVWNWGGNTGSGGGVSPNYAIPAWQALVDMAANKGSTVNRNIPDVALTADGVYGVYNNGSSGTFGGTSCAAPLWAGFCALVNQQSIAVGGSSVGFLNPALYAIGAGSNYRTCFHDITTGNNIGTNTPGLFNAVANYDLCTGLGTPNGTNLINALAPLASPHFITWTNPAPITYGTALSSVQTPPPVYRAALPTRQRTAQCSTRAPIRSPSSLPRLIRLIIAARSAA